MDAAIARLLDGLNDPQREAVLHTDGPLLVLAGPGSGKTRVITRRAALIALTKARAEHVLAITFTNKASREMRERITALSVGRGMTVCTFHAFCAMLLRRYADRAELSRSFTIFDRDDRRKLVRDAIEECSLDSDRWTPAAADSAISRYKNVMIRPADAAAQATDWSARTLARIYEQYEQLLGRNGGLDFDDLLLRVADLLSADAELRDHLEDTYRYVLVDEYQDTNSAQYKIARLLTVRRANLCATGDPDQSIYGWRGADINNILAFEHDYPGAKVVRLEQNYRSTQRILAAADRLIANNKQRKAKTLWTSNEGGERPQVADFETAVLESRAIAGQIKSLLRSGVAAGEIAIFYRVNSLSRGIEEALLREGVRYQIARGVEFYGRKEIKDALAYLRLLVNPADELAVMRALGTPSRGIGDTTIERIFTSARAMGRTVPDMLLAGIEVPGLGRVAGKVRDFAQVLHTLQSALQMGLAEAVPYVLSYSGLRAMYSSKADVDESPAENLNELANAATEFEKENPGATLVQWLEHTALLSDVDSVKDEGGVVTLMTLHAAKGLEFPHVFIIGLEDGTLPLRRADEEVDLEEERRLLFVGMTRAMKSLTLTLSRYRLMRGAPQRTTRSPFLDELAEDEPSPNVSGPIRLPGRSRSRPTPDTGRLPDDIEEWTIGSLVRHPLYGIGRVMSMHRGHNRTHVEVLFRDGSRHRWVLEFAHLERVDFDEIG